MVGSEVAGIGAREARIAAHPQGPQATEGWHHVERHLEGLEDPASELKLQVQRKHLLVTAKGKTETIELPDDSFTDQIRAKYQRGNLKVDVMRKNPAAPAMQEKEMFDPDRQPRDVDIDMPQTRPGALTSFHDREVPQHPPDAVGHGQPTPAQASLNAGPGRRPEGLEGPVDPTVVVPPVGLAASTATDNPVIVHKGGALEAFDGGETVVQDHSKADTKMLVPEGLSSTVDKVAQQLQNARLGPGPGNQAQGAVVSSLGGGDVGPAGRASEEAMKLQAGTDRGWVPEGTVVVQGRRDKALEEEYGSASKTYVDAAAAAHQHTTPSDVGAPSDKSEYEYIETWSSEEEQQGQHIEHEPVDFAKEKVGMATREKTAADFYPRSNDHEFRPMSTLKDQIEAAEMGERVPGLSPGFGYEMTPAQTKREGKPKLKKVRKSVTGKNSHVARDFRMHAKPRNEEKSRAGQGAGGRAAGFADNYEYSDEKVSIARIEEDAARRGISLRTPKHAAEKADKVAEGMAGSPTAWKNTYTGGRVIGNGEDLHLNRGRHEAPRTLG